MSGHVQKTMSRNNTVISAKKADPSDEDPLKKGSCNLQEPEKQ